MRVIIRDNYSDLCDWIAHYIKLKIMAKMNSNETFVIGLPTGSTPIGIYKKLIQFYKNGEISFKNVVTFNMDEYIGLHGTHCQSYELFMYENFFNHIDIPNSNINLLNGMASDLESECNNYEYKITYLLYINGEENDA